MGPQTDRGAVPKNDSSPEMARNSCPATVTSNVTAKPNRPVKKILVVDDNVDSANCLRMFVGRNGCTVQMAHDGLAAVEAAAQFDPDVILLDIGLPRISGHEACRRIRAMPDGDKKIIVALTGWGQCEDYERSVEAGFDHHLVKPIDLMSLDKLLNATP
jgi:CheY-like chemotaxis protein